MATKKRTLDGYFKSSQVKDSPAILVVANDKPQKPSIAFESTLSSTHSTCPFPIPQLPSSLSSKFSSLLPPNGKNITDAYALNCLSFAPLFPHYLAQELFTFLRDELPFYKVRYTIARSGIDTRVITPRYTSVFGIDSTSLFSPSSQTVISAQTSKPYNSKAYKCFPRPIPQCMLPLLDLIQRATNETYNFILINYYADGRDSISYHSDDERFLGPDPTIASLSLGATRDFYLKRKPELLPKGTKADIHKMPLASGDMVLMRGKTQTEYLHSIPKRSTNLKAGLEKETGRINVTFRKAISKGGTENYYRYNTGRGTESEGEIWKWDGPQGQMVRWEKDRK
ncbi:MAG: hypothetical protein M1834_005176 [Cirrosporium novae-zelandiae]|nr:MAG: hypothetical protein M1834_005176 [Cirrosporium novae-zelandiae]